MIAQRPYDEAGEPFPTTFWLSCRVLVRAVGELESSGGIAALEAELAAAAGAAAEPARAPTRASPRCAPALDDGGPRADGGAALADEPRRRRAAARRSSACTPTPRSRSAAPPYAFGRLVLERAGARSPEGCCAWA